MKQDWETYLEAGLREYERGRDRPATQFPHYSESGRWQLLEVEARSEWREGGYEHGNWTAGFWFGTLWLTALGTGDQRVAELARARLPLLAGRADDHTTHDLGFLFHPSVVVGQLCGFLADDELEPALAAARMTVRRFNERGRYIQAFGPVGEPRSAVTSTIDTMMNLPLLWWAAERTGDPQLLEVARHHARTSARLLIRPDGSTVHLMHVDPISGAFLAESTLQGASAQSSWSRGSGWAFAGLVWSYGVTGEHEFLSVAERVAEHYEKATTPGELPPWDFAESAADAPRDASAAAAMALGHLLLGAIHPEAASRTRHDHRGRELLSLLSGRALNRDPDVDGILLESCYSVPRGQGIGGATAWGDFFYGLALAVAVGAVPVDRLVKRRG